MSHIDEGVLHAHLDGALKPGQADWAAAEAHLEVCHDCRRRLIEAREVRDGAARILAGMSPKPLPRPSFQELAAAGAARRVDVAPAPVSAPARRRGPRWWNSPGKLAWAASLVLAVGAGWIGRQLAVEEGFDVPSSALQREASLPSAEEAAASADEATATPGAAAAAPGAANVEFERQAPAGADGVGAPPTPTGAREDFGAYRTDPAGRDDEARQNAMGDASDPALRSESDLRKEGAVARPGEENRDAVLNDAPEAVAAAPQRRLAEEAASEAAPNATPEAASDDASDADQAAAERARAQVSGQVVDRLAAKAESSALCYRAVSDDAGARDMDNLAPVERIRLAADRTAGALVGGIAYVGYWADVGEDSIDVRLSDGERQLALSLRPEGSAMYGTLTRAGRDAAGADPADGLPITLEAAACPTDP